MSTKPVIKKSTVLASNVDKLKDIIHADNAQDQSIYNALLGYEQSMHANVVTTQAIIDTQQAQLFNTVKVILNSDVKDFNRRLTLLTKMSERMALEGGALNGSRPFRRLLHLPATMKTESWSNMISFLSLIGDVKRRRTTLRTVNLSKVAKIAPAKNQQAFIQFYKLLGR